VEAKQVNCRINGDDSGQVTVLLTGAETGGRLVLLATRVRRGQEPPRHLHNDADEVVYVLDGTLTFWVGDETRCVTTGDYLYLPPGVEHGYAVESGEARLLFVLAPEGLAGFLCMAGAGNGEADVEQLVTAAARHGIAITGPSPTTGTPMV
jgi:quercetin dioxygenase-like cupin family protein